MPKTVAERQKKYREKLKRENPEKYEQIKSQNSERTRKTYKRVSELTPEEQEKRRAKWKRTKKRREQNKGNENKDIAAKLQYERKYCYVLKRKNEELNNTIQLLVQNRRCQAKKIYRLRKKICELEKVVKTLNEKEDDHQIVEPDINATSEEEKQTPGTRTEQIMEESFNTITTPEKKVVKKVLFENELLKESLSQQYNQAICNSERNTLKKVINNDTVQKYKMKSKLTECLGLKGRIRNKVKLNKYKIKRLKELNDFFERDDNSRATAGKKEYKTLRKTKKQVRYLLDTLNNLHKKYRREGGKLSYATFTRFKPFYVISPKLTDRNTCACIKHSNLSFVASKLKHLGLIKTANIAELVSTISCNVNDQKCMYQECDRCFEKCFEFNVSLRKPTDIVTWYRWVTKTFTYSKLNSVKQKEEKTTKRTVKEEVTESLQTLQQTFIEQLRLIKKHVFNVKHQFRMYTDCKKSLTEKEIVLHCDFSENYVCKLSEEVQSMHFGASKRQVSLHTGVIYAVPKDKPQTISFCTIAGNNNHSPSGIWAHLTPVLKYIKEKCPAAETIHFYSDGPTSQYRQKNNFYLMNTTILEFGFKKATWSFFEASHGKGAADGIGGATKRALDRYVAYGKDIPDANSAYSLLINDNSMKINYFYIPDENIDALTEYLDSTTKPLIPVPNTMTVHQVISTSNPDIVKYRKLSCFCKPDCGFCECYTLKEHNLKLKRAMKVVKNKASKTTRQRKLDRDSRSSSDDTDYSVKFAESDDSYCIDYETSYDESNLKEDIDKPEMHVEQVLDDQTGLFKQCFDPKKMIITFDNENTGKSKMYIEQELDEETGFFKQCNEPKNNKVNILSMIIVKPDHSPISEQKFETKTKERKVKLGEKTQNQRNHPNKVLIKNENVTALSEIRLRPENTVHFDLSKCEALKENVKNSEKENYCCYENPIASTSKNMMYDIIEKSDRNYKKVGGDTKLVMKDEDCASSDSHEGDTTELLQKYKINDSVIVRYYQRKIWKYYIGFIKSVENEDGEHFFQIQFLKMVKKPKLKFTTSNKKDVDYVPISCIVKIVNLTQNPQNFKEYYLTDDCDTVYF